MYLFTNAKAGFQSELQLLLDAGWVEVLLEDEKVSFLVEDDELRIAQCYDTVDPQRDMGAGRFDYLNFSLSTLLQLESGDASSSDITDYYALCQAFGSDKGIGRSQFND